MRKSPMEVKEINNLSTQHTIRDIAQRTAEDQAVSHRFETGQLLAQHASQPSRHDQAIKLARLFGATGAGNTAVANQAQSALGYRLDQQAIDANRRSMQRGYQWMFDDLALRGNKAARVDASKGQTAQALGGLLMSYGGKGGRPVVSGVLPSL